MQQRVVVRKGTRYHYEIAAARPALPPLSPEKIISPTQEGEYHADDDHATTDDEGHRRRLGGGGSDTSGAYSNTGSDGEIMFIVSGWMMLALAVGNYLMSRWVVLRLLKKAGCEGTREYAERLTVIEKQTMGAKVGLSSGHAMPWRQTVLLPSPKCVHVRGVYCIVFPRTLSIFTAFRPYVATETQSRELSLFAQPALSARKTPDDRGCTTVTWSDSSAR